MSWRGLAAWAVVLLVLIIVASGQRHRALASVNAACIKGMQPYAELEHEQTVSQWYSSGLGDYYHKWVGPAVYLIESGKRDPELLRLMLLTEARKSYDNKFLYSYSWNYDLRGALIEECQQAFPDDPAVAWAAGRCYLTASEFDLAADELLRADELGFADSEQIKHKNTEFHGRLLIALHMANRDQEAFDWLAQHAESVGTEEAYTLWADHLCDFYQYEAALDACDTGLARWPDSLGLNLVRLRALWWSGQYQDFETAVFFAEERYGNVPQLQWTLARVAILNHDYDKLEEYYPLLSNGWASALAEGYGLLGEDGCLVLLNSGLMQAESNRTLAEGTPTYWQDKYGLSSQVDGTFNQIVRAHLLRQDWDSVRKMLARAPEYSYIFKHSVNLANLYVGLLDGRSAELLYSSGVQWAFLPQMKFAPEYLAAMEAGQRDPDETWLKMLEQLRQQEKNDSWVAKGTYRDYSNGELDW